MRCDCETIVTSIDIYGDLSMEGDGISTLDKIFGNRVIFIKGATKRFHKNPAIIHILHFQKHAICYSCGEPSVWEPPFKGH